MMKAVFFDLDGTLIDSDPYWVRSQETLVRSCGGEWSDTLADALQGAAFPETVRLLRGAGVDWDGDAIVRHLSDEVLRMEKERLPWIEGVRDVLSGLAAAHVPAVLVLMCSVSVAASTVTSIFPFSAPGFGISSPAANRISFVKRSSI